MENELGVGIARYKEEYCSHKHLTKMEIHVPKNNWVRLKPE